MSNIIEIENLSKNYETGFWIKKKIKALDSLTLVVERGQIFGFLGGNGAGKTTTIKILMGLLYPTTGTARIMGENISNMSMHRFIGYCPENPYFYDYLTPLELMNYFGSLFGLDKTENARRSRDLLTKVGLEQKDWGRQLRKFSKGMLQRVGIAQSLIGAPEIVFLDEPMSGLDPIGRREIRELIARLRDEEGTSVFMSTHILSDIEALCDQVAIMHGGKLAAAGRLDELLTNRSGSGGFEIIVKGIDAAALEAKITCRLPPITRTTTPPVPEIKISAKAQGIHILVPDQRGVELVLAANQEAGGTLVGVQSARHSLEDLFVKQTEDRL